jgi:hypothetical protein
LRVELEDLSRRSFKESWDQISSQYPELFAFCGMIASVMSTTAFVESDFSRLRGAKSDHRCNMSCLSLEGINQVSDLVIISKSVDVPFKFPSRK